jgi:dTDP-glucose 4,6-dehydratase
MSTVLVTGGAGFIGSNFIRYMFNRYRDCRLIVVDALTYAGSVENFPRDAMGSNRFEFWYGDVRNAQLMDTMVAQSDVVIHMAAESHVTRSIYDNAQFFETDVLGTQTVANAVVKHAKTVKLFVHLSTSEVYGTAVTERMNEDHPLNPMSPYASAKCGADRLVYSYAATYGIPAVIVRPFNNFGPTQHLEKVVPRFVTSCLLKEPLTVHGDGSAARDFLYVDDHCLALDMLMHADSSRVVGQTINLGTGRHTSIAQVAAAVKTAMRADEVPVEYIGDRPGQVFRHTCNADKAGHLLDWRPRTSFEEGMERTVKWYRDNEKWWRRQMWMRHIPIITASGKRELH